MKIIEIKERNSFLIEQLLRIWKDSVKLTHSFLSDKEIDNIKKFVPKALESINNLIVMYDDSMSPSMSPFAFMGIENQKLEMLFVSPQFIGKGYGKQLIQHGIKYHSINELTVNEQNPLAKGFYEHMGFQVYKRTPNDEQGNPYPILYMKL